MISVHCMNHCTNMVVQTFYKLGIMWKIEDVLQSLYVYFSHSLKRFHEFVELANIGETWGHHNLGKIKTHGISMVFPIKKMLFKYCILVLKMFTLLHKLFKTWEIICNLEVMWGLSCIVPMLERLNDVIKFLIVPITFSVWFCC
jgi:hypothetical protein